MNFIYVNIICTIVFFTLSAQFLQRSSFNTFFTGSPGKANTQKHLSKHCFYKSTSIPYNSNAETIDRDLDHDIPDLPATNNPQEEKCKDESATKSPADTEEQYFVVYNGQNNLFNDAISSQYIPILIFPPPRQ
jgi:hypothetical protein